MACVEKIFINLNAPSAFNLRQKILGDQNSNLQYIVNETKANVTLRGRGSGFIEQLMGVESSESLHLYIEHPVLKNLIEAKNYARNLLETIQSDLQIFLQTNQSIPMQQPPPMITSTHSMTMPTTVLSVPPPNINATHIIQQPNFIPQTHIIPQQMQIIQQTPINIPPPLRTNAPISVQFQGQPANIQIQQAGQPILLNQAPVQQQYQFQYIPTATAPQTQTIQHFIQPQQQIQGILQPHGQQFITLQGNTAFMIPPPNIMQNPTAMFGSVPPIINNSDDTKADGSKMIKEEQKNQLGAAAGRAIVTNINQPPPPIQQFIVNANPWPQNQQQQMPLNSQIQILTQQQPQTSFHRNGNEIVIQSTPSASTQGQQIITTFNPAHQGQSLQQIQFANQPIISQPPPSTPQFSQAQFLQNVSSDQARPFSTAPSLSYQQQFEQKINMGPEYQQQRAMKRKIIDEAADTKGTFTKAGMGAMTKNRPPPTIPGHQQMLKSRNTKSAGDVMSINSNSSNKSLHNQNKGLGTANMSSKVNVSQVEMAKSPPTSSTFTVATAKGENEFIDTQSFDIANQAFMQQPPPNIQQQFNTMSPRGQMIMFQTQPPPSTNVPAQHQDANNFQGMTRYNVPREMMMPTNNDVGSANFHQQQQQQKFQQHW